MSTIEDYKKTNEELEETIKKISQTFIESISLIIQGKLIECINDREMKDLDKLTTQTADLLITLIETTLTKKENDIKLKMLDKLDPKMFWSIEGEED